MTFLQRHSFRYTTKTVSVTEVKMVGMTKNMTDFKFLYSD